jgi:Predicted unsaturated glucuronyl hydrolase involved in regulation of bacterial surface properties, and related proteins
MLDAKSLDAKMDQIILRMTDPTKVDIVESCPISNLDFTKWEWPQGVGLYGLCKLYLATKDTHYWNMLDSWYEARIAEGLPGKNVNTMAPMLAYVHLYEIDRRKDRLERCVEWAEWVMREMPRTRDGGLQHIVTGRRNDGQLWVDTLYMTVLFLAKAGMVLGRREYVDEAVRQFLVHVKYLADRRTGLWFHGWTFEGNNNFGRIHWGRGNCWFTAGVVDFIEMIGLEGGAKSFLVDTLKDQVDALSPLQEPEGIWHTVLDDPSSYVESSATAGFGYGILKAVRLGLLPESYRAMGLKACEAVLARVDETGAVGQVSYGTPMGNDADFYKKIPVCPMAYGQALTVHLLGEARRLIIK